MDLRIEFIDMYVVGGIFHRKGENKNETYGLILVHNHPPGYPEPSKEDIGLTKNFAKAAKFVDCEVLDHVIIGDGIYTSLHERGVI